MKIRIVICIAVAAVLFGGCVAQKQKESPLLSLGFREVGDSLSGSMASLKLSSSSFSDGEVIPSLYTCDGADVNPPLAIGGIPEGAKSLALIVDDPDAPSGDWVHWVVWNIRPDTREIAENTVPEEAVEGMTDFGETGWNGPCPPSGTHRYYFKLYALDTALDLPASARKKELEAAMRGHILESATTIGLYARQTL